MNSPSSLVTTAFLMMSATESKQPFPQRWKRARDEYQEELELEAGYVLAMGAWASSWLLIPLGGMILTVIGIAVPTLLNSIPTWIPIYFVMVLLVAPVWMLARTFLPNNPPGPGWTDDTAIALIAAAIVSAMFFFFGVD